MQNTAKKVLDKVIDYSIPVLCASVPVWFDKLPGELQKNAPMAIVAVAMFYVLIVTNRTRRDVEELKAIHKKSDELNDVLFAALRIDLNEAMQNLYKSCLKRGYTTEYERRSYKKIQAAYEGVKGNGESIDRRNRFFAMMHEEEYLVSHPQNHENRERSRF